MNDSDADVRARSNPTTGSRVDRSWVQVRSTEAYTVVIPAGDIYTDTDAPLRGALLTCTAGACPRVVLNLATVRVCDASGLHLMVQTHRAAAERGGWLRLVGIRPLVQAVISGTDLASALVVYPTVEDATADVAHPPHPHHRTSNP